MRPDGQTPLIPSHLAKVAGLTLTISFGAFMEEYRQGYIELTGRERKVSRSRLNQLKRVLGNHLLLTPLDIDGFMRTLIGKTPATRNRMRSLLMHMVGWGRERGFLEGELPKGLLKKEPEHNSRERRLEPGEEKLLVVHMGTELRNLFHAALDTGLRYGTLRKLKWRDIQGDTIVVPASIQKHRESQRIPLTKRLMKLTPGPPDTEMFPIQDFRGKWERAKQKAGVKGLRWHDLRGEFASRLDEAGVETIVTSRLLGHHSLTTTQRYLRPRVERFKGAIERLGV